ncbi:MAG TPA: YdcF family protein [Candidatus Paceibacterota bacterium]
MQTVSSELIQNLRVILDFLTASTPIENLPVCDGIFLFGSSKTDLIPKSGANLFKKGLARKIICTGKHTLRLTSGPMGFPTEAEWYVDVLIREGIPQETIIVENESTNTLENILFGIDTCRKHNFHPRSLILCPIPPLCCRSLATFKKQFPEIEVFGHTFESPVETYLAPDRMKRIFREFERFKEYSAKGDMAEVTVPQNIQDSVNFLKSHQ